MEKVGLNPASSQDEADCLVGYKYRIGTGKTVVSSSPDFVFGGHNVHSTTVIVPNASFVKGEGHSDDQEIHDHRVIGRTV